MKSRRRRERKKKKVGSSDGRAYKREEKREKERTSDRAGRSGDKIISIGRKGTLLLACATPPNSNAGSSLGGKASTRWSCDGLVKLDQRNEGQRDQRGRKENARGRRQRRREAERFSSICATPDCLDIALSGRPGLICNATLPGHSGD